MTKNFTCVKWGFLSKENSLQNSRKGSKLKEKNSRFLQNQKLELSGIGQICKPEVNVKLTKQIKWLKL